MLLAVIIGFFIVSCALGFALGWYVRSGYVKAWQKKYDDYFRLSCERGALTEVEMSCLRADTCRLYNVAVKADPDVPLKGEEWEKFLQMCVPVDVTNQWCQEHGLDLRRPGAMNYGHD